jgi:hypothetical protein
MTGPWESVGVWVAALLTLFLYSFLYRDNPFYKFAEHLFVGVSAGYAVARTYFDGFLRYVWEPLRHAVGWYSEREIRQLAEIGRTPSAEVHELMVIVPMVLGLLYFARFVPGFHWLVRIPTAFLLGAASGISIPLVLKESVFAQMFAAIAPFGSREADYVGLTIVLVGTVTALTYFFFSVERRGAVGWASRVGIWFLMIGFGSAFGNTVMNRVMLLIQRVEFLLRDWLHVLRS